MKKIFPLLILLAAVQSFAIYFDLGLGLGGASTSNGERSFGDQCKDCGDMAVTLNFRMGEKILPNLWVAGEISGVGNRYTKDVIDIYGNKKEKYVQFNSYYLGPSVVFYPINHIHLSSSLGFSWTCNQSNVLPTGWHLENGTGIAFSLTAAYDTGISNGALIGAKFYTSHVSLEHSKKSLSTTGLLFFVSFVHK